MKRIYFTLSNHWSYCGVGWSLGLESCVVSFEDCFRLIDEVPGLKINLCFDVHCYEKLKEEYPEVLNKIKKYLEKGSIDIVAGTYTQPYALLISGESIIRQIELGRYLLKRLLNYKPKVFLEEEAFTFPQLPQIAKLFGYKVISFDEHKTGAEYIWADPGNPIVEKDLIEWIGKDGTFIKAVPKNKLYGGYPNPTEKDLGGEHYSWKYFLKLLEGDLKEFKRPFLRWWQEFGWDNWEDLGYKPFVEILKYLASKYSITFVSYLDYVKDYPYKIERIKFNLDDWNQELPWGVGGDQIRFYNSIIEGLLLDAEKLEAIAYLLGGRSKLTKLKEAWKNLMIGQCHDCAACEYYRIGHQGWIGCMPMPNTHKIHNCPWGQIGYYHMMKAEDLAKNVIDESLRDIAKRINFSKGDKFLIVFNSSLRSRDDILELEKIRLKSLNLFVLNDKDEIVPSQISKMDSLQLETEPKILKLLIYCKDVPSLGYKTYSLYEGYKETNTDLQVRDFQIENSKIRIEIDKESGGLKSLYDKTLEEEFIDNGYFFTIKGKVYDGFPFMGGIRIDSSKNKSKVWITERGPVRATIKAYQEILLETQGRIFNVMGIEYNYSLYCYSNKLEAMIRINSQVAPSSNLKEGFSFVLDPLIKNYKIKRDYPFGVELTNKDSFSSLSFINIFNDKKGLLILHSGTQYFWKEGKMIYNLFMRDNHFAQTLEYSWPKYMEFKYTLIPTKGEVDNYTAMVLSEEKRSPLRCILTNKYRGELPRSLSFFSSNSKDILLTSLRRKDRKLQIRLLNCSDEERKFEWESYFSFKKVYKVSLDGKLMGSVNNLRPWEIATLNFIR